jgi:predicted AlkP superfamily phosphohydrolase/phosphomutase
VSLPAEAEAIGSWVKLLALAPDATSAKVYLGSPSHTNAAPAAFLAELNQALGPWPGGPDDRHLGRSLIDEGTWREQALRLNTWLRDATLRTLQRDDWDLLFAYLPIIDETQHRFLLRHPRHPDYDAEGGERRRRFNRYVEWAYQTADRFLLEWIEAAPAGTNFIIVSDHGVLPIHTRLNIHTLLRRAGLRITDDESTEVRAYASVTTANIYVNLAGRQPGGVVRPERLAETVRRIVAACKALRDPVTGEPVFETVLTRAELGQVHLAHSQNAGDVWVNTRPGFKVSGWMDEGAPLFEPTSDEPSTHGSLSLHPRIRSIFYAAGVRVPRQALGLVSIVDVAPTVAALLSIDPPANSQGRARLQPVR